MDFNKRRVTVMGLGSFGGGLGAVQYLVQQGAAVTVTDLRSEADLADSLTQLQDTPPLALHLGGHQAADFVDTDLLVVSPAVPRSCPFLKLARDAGIPITSEMNLFWGLNRGSTVAITGSNGKSTTTAMIHAILTAAGRRSWLGGNIGRSLLPLVDQIQPSDAVVLELSSFQLEDLDQLQKSPQVAVITNFSPNHLDRHGTLDAYRHAKQAILRWQSGSDLAILNQDDPDVVDWPTRAQRLYSGLHDEGREGLFLTAAGPAVFRFQGKESQIPIAEWLTIPGRHNLQNALGAACAALALQTPIDGIKQGLLGYKALPHRLELVAEVSGRSFYNDSLATTPESTIVALEAFERPIILFAGGYDKGSDFEAMMRAIAGKPVKAVALMGVTGPKLAGLLDGLDPSRSICREVCTSFQAAFEWAVRQSSAGDVLLLSPGCASYDWFRNFADRGAQFRKLAERARDFVVD